MPRSSPRALRSRRRRCRFPTGSTSTVRGRTATSPLDFRRRLDERCGGSLWRYCEASCVFSALELLKARHRWREYIADARVKEALAAFPLSVRHPFVAAAVSFLRLAAPRARGEGKGA